MIQNAPIIPALPEHSPFTFGDVPYPYPVNYFEFNKSQVAYVDHGSGQPVLFIHGQGADLSSFAPIYPALEQQFRLLALDLPGFGKSDKPEPKLSVAYYSDLINTMVGELGLEELWLVGHSFGGLVALIYAETCSELLTGLTLIDSAGFYEYPLPAQMIFKQAFSVDAILNTPAEIARQNYYLTTIRHKTTAVEHFIETRIHLLENKTVEYLNFARTMTANIELLFEKHFLHETPRLEFPIQLIHGRQDQLVPLAGAMNAEDLFPQAHLDILNDCGHFPFLEHTAQFNELLLEFLVTHMKVSTK